MRLATFNMENLFRRPVAMSLPTWKDGRETLESFPEVTAGSSASDHAAAWVDLDL